MVVMVLLSLIVLALMAVFNSTQTAFRAGVTQTDVLEGGRATMDLMASDLRNMAPSLGASSGAVNFYANANVGICRWCRPIGQRERSQRTNALEKIFILSRNNATDRHWTATGYMVDTCSNGFHQSALPFFHQHERRGGQSLGAVRHLHQRSLFCRRTK